MKTYYRVLPFIILLLFGCNAKSPIKYSPIGDNYQSSSDKKEIKEASELKLSDELLKEDERLYKELRKQTIGIENAEDEDEDGKNELIEEGNEYRIDGRNDIAWFEIGMKAFEHEKWNEALNAFNKSIRINPRNPEAYFNRGSVYDELGDYNQAIINYNRAIKLNPTYPDAYLGRGFAYNNLGKLNKAIADIKKAAKLGNAFAQNFLKKRNITW